MVRGVEQARRGSETGSEDGQRASPTQEAVSTDPHAAEKHGRWGLWFSPNVACRRPRWPGDEPGRLDRRVVRANKISRLLRPSRRQLRTKRSDRAVIPDWSLLSRYGRTSTTQLESIGLFLAKPSGWEIDVQIQDGWFGSVGSAKLASGFSMNVPALGNLLNALRKPKTGQPAGDYSGTSPASPRAGRTHRRQHQPTKTPMIAITTSNSISVKPTRRRERMRFPFPCVRQVAEPDRDPQQPRMGCCCTQNSSRKMHVSKLSPMFVNTYALRRAPEREFAPMPGW